MIQLIQGKRSASVTYWIGLFGFNLLITLYIFLITPWKVRTILAGQEGLALGVSTALMGIGVCWALLMARALWRSMHDARTPSVWTWIGMLLIAVGTISYAYNGYKVQNPSVRVTTLSIHQEFNAILMSLPIEVESSVMLVDAGLRGSVLSDTYQIAKGIGDRTADSLNTEELRTRICTDLEGYYKGPVETVSFSYQYDDGKLNVPITRADCGY